MNYRNTTEAWGWVARSLHWLMAALILIQFSVGWIGHQMDRTPAKIDVMTGHKSLGITLLLLALLRLLWRWSNPLPRLPEDSRAWEWVLSRISHAAMYFVMVALPLCGWLAASASVLPWKFWWFIRWPRIARPDKALYELAAEAHEILGWMLLALLAVHLAAALRHHFFKHNRVLLRMWRGQ